MKNKILKQIISILILLQFSFSTCYAAVPQKNAKSDAPVISAKSAVLIDMESGRVLYSKNPNQKLPMASTTKIMTAILAIEKGNLNDIVTINDKAIGIEGSSIYLIKGEKLKLEDLLYGLMLNSGNDSAVAVAYHIGGSIENFANMMNEKAYEIGAYNTHFMNPNGLDNIKHYTTAYDLSLIASYAMKNPEFRKIVSTKAKRIPWKDHDYGRSLSNSNKILTEYEGGNGVKTGYTKTSGRCLVAGAKRQDMQLISTVINCGNWFKECESLMNWGFKNYKETELVKKGKKISDIKIVNGVKENIEIKTDNSIIYPLKEDEAGKISMKTILPESLKAPIKYGQYVGYIQYFIDNKPICKQNLYIRTNVEKNNMQYKIKKYFKKIFH